MSAQSDERELETIGRRLRRLRTERGLSQRELSAPGVSYAYISRIEAGTRQPSVKALRKLARNLGVSADYLETGSDVRDSELRELRLAQAELDLRLGEDTTAAEQALVAVISEAEEVGDKPAERRARAALGLAAFEAGRTAEAVELLEQAVSEGDPAATVRPDVYAALGRAYALLGRSDRAVELFERCLAALNGSAEANVPAKTRFATHLSCALADAGELERSQSVVQDALAGVEAFTDPYTHVRAHRSLGLRAGGHGRPVESLEHLRRALALLEATEDAQNIARAHLACARSLIEGERAADAAPHLAAAERLLGAQPPTAEFVSLRTEQARYAAATGDAEAAVRLAREAVDALADGLPDQQANAQLALAEGLALQEDASAGDAFGRAADAFVTAGKPQDAARAHRALGQLLRRLGRESEALDAFERAADLAVRASREQ